MFSLRRGPDGKHPKVVPCARAVFDEFPKQERTDRPGARRDDVHKRAIVRALDFQPTFTHVMSDAAGGSDDHE